MNKGINLQDVFLNQVRKEKNRRNDFSDKRLSVPGFCQGI